MLAVVWLCFATPVSYVMLNEFAYRDWVPVMGKIVAVRSEAVHRRACHTNIFLTVEYATLSGVRIQEEQPLRCVGGGRSEALQNYNEYMPILYNPARPTEFIAQSMSKRIDPFSALLVGGVAILIIVAPRRKVENR